MTKLTEWKHGQSRKKKKNQLCNNTPLANPHYLNLINNSLPSGRLVVSLISDQGYFTFLYGHTKHKLQAQEEGSLRHFPSILCICGIARACIRAKIPAKSPGMLTHPLTLANPPSGFTYPSSHPLSHDDCPILSTSMFYSGTFLPSSSFGLVGDLTRKPFVWVSRKNSQRDPLTGTHPHPHNECLTSCHTCNNRKERRTNRRRRSTVECGESRCLVIVSCV